MDCKGRIDPIQSTPYKKLKMHFLTNFEEKQATEFFWEGGLTSAGLTSAKIIVIGGTNVGNEGLKSAYFLLIRGDYNRPEGLASAIKTVIGGD